MKVYCDTSFLMSLYLDIELHHQLAARSASKFTAPIPYTLLCELELTNALRRLAAAKRISMKVLETTLDQIERDIREGFLERFPMNQATQYKVALDISKRQIGLMARSLDILHVAAAKLTAATEIASFDVKQRDLAKAESLHLLPAKI